MGQAGRRGVRRVRERSAWVVPEVKGLGHRGYQADLGLG